MKTLSLILASIMSFSAIAATNTIQVTQPVSRTTGATSGTTIVPAQDATTAAQVGTQSPTSGSTLETNTNGKTTKQILDERTRGPGSNVEVLEYEKDSNGVIRVKKRGQETLPSTRIRTIPGNTINNTPTTEIPR